MDLPIQPQLKFIESKQYVMSVTFILQLSSVLCVFLLLMSFESVVMSNGFGFGFHVCIATKCSYRL